MGTSPGGHWTTCLGGVGVLQALAGSVAVGPRGGFRVGVARVATPFFLH